MNLRPSPESGIKSLPTVSYILSGVSTILSIVYLTYIPLFEPHLYSLLVALLASGISGLAVAQIRYTRRIQRGIDTDEYDQQSVNWFILNTDGLPYELREGGIVTTLLLIVGTLLLAPTRLMGWIPGVAASSYTPSLKSAHYLQTIFFPIVLLFSSEVVALLLKQKILSYLGYRNEKEPIADCLLSIIGFGIVGILMMKFIEWSYGIWIGLIVTYLSGLGLVSVISIGQLSSDITLDT